MPAPIKDNIGIKIAALNW